jgi:SWIM zinc finger
MDYGMIGKIEKAKRYAEQRDRIKFESLQVTFEGENNPHTVRLENGMWQCDCDFFQSRGRCSHTMALELILQNMLPEIVYET